jgi:hypothetical protein
VLAGKYFNWDVVEVEVFVVEIGEEIPSRPIFETSVEKGRLEAVPPILYAKSR